MTPKFQLQNDHTQFRILKKRPEKKVCSEYVQSMFRVCSEYVQGMFRVCSEYVQGMESDSLSHVFEILSNLGHIIRLSSGYVQGIFRVCSGYV